MKTIARNPVGLNIEPSKGLMNLDRLNDYLATPRALRNSTLVISVMEDQ